MLRGRATRGTDAKSHAPLAVRVGGNDGVGDEIRRRRRGRAVGLDSRQVPEVTGIAVHVTGGPHVGVVLVESNAHRRQREHHEQCRSYRRRPLQRLPIEEVKASRSQADRRGCSASV